MASRKRNFEQRVDHNKDEEEVIETKAKEIMKHLLDHEAYIPSTYDTENKIINFCKKNLVKSPHLTLSSYSFISLHPQAAHHYDVEETKADLMARYHQSETEPRRSQRKRTPINPIDRPKRQRRKKGPYKTEIVKVEENRPIVEMINEMCERYFLSGDRQRGSKSPWDDQTLFSDFLQ